MNDRFADDDEEPAVEPDRTIAEPSLLPYAVGCSASSRGGALDVSVGGGRHALALVASEGEQPALPDLHSHGRSRPYPEMLASLRIERRANERDRGDG